MKKILRVLLTAILATSMISCSNNKEEIDIEKTYTAEDVYKIAERSFFYIRVLQEDEQVKATGTGFFLLADEKLAVTAYHVVEDAEKIELIMNDEEVIKNVEIMAFDRTKDVAILKLPNEEQAEKYSGLEVREEPINFGVEVFAIGFPLKGTPIVTEGIINNPSTNINGRSRILTSAEIASGMSGGPLLDSAGKIVGLISGSLRTLNNIHLVVDTETIVSTLKGE